MVLLETLELLLDEDSTSVMEVMSRHVIKVLLALPHLLSVNFTLIFVLSVGAESKNDKDLSPEDAFMHVFETTIKVHRVERLRSVEVRFIRVHVMLKFNSVFRGNKFGILMIFLKEIMYRRLMEFSSESKSSSSNSTSALLRKTTSVETEIVSVVLFTLRLEFSQTFFGITSCFRLCSSDITSSVTLSEVVLLVEFSFRNIIEGIRVLSSHEVIVSSVLVD